MFKNTYIVYVEVNDRNGVEKKYIIPHKNFQKSIEPACINHTKYRSNFTTPIAKI